MFIIKRIGKIILLLIALLPIIFWVLGITIVGDSIPTNDPFFNVLGAFIILTVPAQWVFYVANVFVNETVTKNTRALWIVLLIGGNFVVFPFYWYIHVWKDTNRNIVLSDDKENTLISREQKLSCLGKNAKLILLIAGFLPILLGGVSLIIAFNIEKNVLFYVFAAVTYMITLVIIALYVMNVFRNININKEQKALWTVLFIFSNVIIFPFYWYFYIWRDNSRRSTLNKT